MKIQEAILAWQRELPTKAIITQNKYIERAARTTFKTNASILAIIQPSEIDQLIDAVKIANKFKIPIYPVSCGKNYGYGSRVPVALESVLFDLSRMNRILGLDEQQGVLTVEPGVSFEQAFNFLNKAKSSYVLAGTGAPPSSSLIGNTLERGLGKGPAGNRIDHVCNLEVVLANGEVLHTGIGRYKNAEARHLTQGGAGPSLDGFFSQSNFAIITKISFWLTRRPSHFQTFTYAIKDEKKLPYLLDSLHDLRQKDILLSNSAIFNDYRLLGILCKYPWELHNGKTVLPQSIVNKALKKSIPFKAKWIGDGALFCHSKSQAFAEKRLIKKALKGKVDTLFFFNANKIKFYSYLASIYSFFTKRDLLKSLEPNFTKSAYLGHPIPFALQSTYFKKKAILPDRLDPDLDGCGTIWLGPIVPFDSQKIKKAIDIITKTLLKYQYEPALTLQLITKRQVDIIASITYDRNEPGQDEKAKECHDLVWKKLMNEGFYPYRLGIQSQQIMPEANDYYEEFIRIIKQCLDPNDIIAPGRYDFRHNWSS
jgi:4-cresol dehydrogenase (hydroxylating) flavoprotein subunit